MIFQKQKRIVDKKAIEAARRSHCEYCGRAWMIEVHHIKSRGSGGHDEASNLISLCKDCHMKVHSGQIPRRNLLYIIGRRERGE